MQFPPFRGFGPSEAIKQLSQWIHQPMLTHALKEAAQKLGLKEVPPLSSFQELLRQAGRWVDAAVEPWSGSDASRMTPGVNATGELFSTRWTAPRLVSECIPLSNVVSANFTEDSGIETHCRTLLMGSTGATDALVAPNLAVALNLVASGLSASERIDEWIMPRMSCIRFPSGPSHGGVLVRQVLDAAGADVQEIGTSTECLTLDYDRAISTSKKLLMLASPTHPDANRASGIARVRATQGLVCELALDGCLHDLRELGLPIDALSRRWDEADILIVPGHHALAGPECGIILGRLDTLAPIRAFAEQSGMLASRWTHWMLCESLRGTQSREGWGRSPTGATLSTSLANLENRALRIANQCDEMPGIQVTTQPSKIGSGAWHTVRLESAVLKITPQNESASRLAERLADNVPPIWCNVQSDHVELVLRTIEPAEDSVVVAAIQKTSPPTEEAARPSNTLPQNSN
jgi:L-seryl-tRNA(Ser) seleniumtransferase